MLSLLGKDSIWGGTVGKGRVRRRMNVDPTYAELEKEMESKDRSFLQC